MLRIRPPSAISGSSFWVRKKGALSWIWTSSSNCSSVVSANGALMPMPALLMRKSKFSRPNSSRSAAETRSANPPKPAGSAASNGSITARAPLARISAATASASSFRLRYVPMTLTPDRARCPAMLRPSPRLAPVSTAIFSGMGGAPRSSGLRHLPRYGEPPWPGGRPGCLAHSARPGDPAGPARRPGAARRLRTHSCPPLGLQPGGIDDPDREGQDRRGQDRVDDQQFGPGAGGEREWLRQQAKPVPGPGGAEHAAGAGQHVPGDVGGAAEEHGDGDEPQAVPVPDRGGGDRDPGQVGDG